MIKSNALGVPLMKHISLGGCTNYTRAEYIKVRDRLFKPRRIVSWKEGAKDSIVSPTYLYNSNYYGNLVQETDADGCVKSYLYGHNGLYPCYKVEGVEWRNIYAPEVFFTGSAESVPLPEQQDALVSAIEYSPYLGVTATITPWGCRSIYDYDKEGRLGTISIEGIGTQETFTYQTSPDVGFVNTSERWLGADGKSRHKKETRYDGLGRLIANIDMSAIGKDSSGSFISGVSEHFMYDNMGRLSRVAENVAGTEAPADSYSWKRLLYEASPRNILTAEIKAGEQWMLNNKKLTIRNSSSPTKPLIMPYYYSDAAGNIKSSTKITGITPTRHITDEDGIIVTRTTDADGRLLMSGRGSDDYTMSKTHYIYDNFGRLRYILPPSIATTDYSADDPELEEHAYIYRYDERDRLTFSKTPGAAPSHFVYSPAGRLVAETNATLGNGVWRLHLYDKFGREVVTGTATLTDTHINSLSEKAWIIGRPTGDYISDRPSDAPLLYDLSHIPMGADFYPEKIRVYDTYPEYVKTFSPDATAGTSYLDEPTGLLTFAVSRHTDATFHHETYYYDRYGRPIQTTSWHLQADLVHSVAYNYAGAKSKEHTRVKYQTSTDHLYSLLKRYTYDSAERLKNERVYLSGGDTVCIESTYSASGQLNCREYYMGEHYLVELNNPKKDCIFWKDFEYDIHGWPTKAVTRIPDWVEVFPGLKTSSEISRPFYSRATGRDSIFIPGITIKPRTIDHVEEILYAEGANPRYNGTPSAHIAVDGSRYDYRYDSFDRLVGADYTPKDLDSDEDFSTSYQYDNMSRPVAVTRYGVVDSDGENESFGILDKFTLDYDGPLLSEVSSAYDDVEGTDFYGRTGLQSSLSPEPAPYIFNTAGRLKKDGSTGSIYQYTSTGLVSEIRYREPLTRLQNSEFIVYDAEGRRLKRWQTIRGSYYKTLSNRIYLGPITLNFNSLERVDFPGGYFDGDGKAHFLLTDWQGNVDMVIDRDRKIVQRNTYYPYGEPHREPSGQRVLYSGKERQDFIANGTSDFDPRRYFSYLPLWGAGDIKADDYADISPYVFCGANPIRNIDPSGNDYFIFNTSGHLISREPDKDEDVIAIRMNDGVIKESKSMKVHSIQSVTDKIINYPEKGVHNLPITTLKIKGDNNSDVVFRFLAENSDVEFTHIKTGKAGVNGVSYITTSHDDEHEYGFGDLFLKQLQFGYTLREHTHSHPSGDDWISTSDSSTVSKLSKINNNLIFYLFVVSAEDSIQYIRYFPTTRPRQPLLPK
ncbi:MAG: hypothetical protein K2K22_01470 [Muribaculaceae bacterium]|nr:hypothetical protein [Muribaculaceae bacterium]